MATDKTQTKTIEEPQTEKKEVKVSAKLSEINYQEDIHKPSLESLAEDWAEEEEKLNSPEQPKEEVVVKADEKPAEEIKEEPVVENEQPKEEAKPVIDDEKIAQSVTKAVLEQLAPEDKAEKKDIKEKIADLAKKAADEGRELTYTEALEFLQNETKESVKQELKAELKDEVKKELSEELHQEVETESAKQEAAKKDLEVKQQAAWKEFDRQFDSLTEKGDIPQMADKNDKEDPGRKERVAILEAMREWNTKNPSNPVSNIVEFFYTKYSSPNKMPAGADAPVFGAKRSVTPVDPDSYSYSDIRNASLEDLVHANG